MKLTFFKGLPGSGKSTEARAFCEKNPDWIRVNRDDIRHQVGKYWLPKRESLITAMEDAMVVEALKAGYNVLIDATNLSEAKNKARVSQWCGWAGILAGDVSVTTKFFDTPVEECIRRDLARTNSVGEKVIRDMWRKYLAPPPVIYTEDIRLPHCIIVDIDGTLALKGTRSPYDWARVGEDTPNIPIVNLVRTISEPDIEIILFSGRDEVCRQETEAWLDAYDIGFDALYMRPAGNNEKDTVIKQRLFEEHIRGKYYVEYVVDDRPSVIRMWKELGLCVLNVGDGIEF